MSPAVTDTPKAPFFNVRDYGAYGGGVDDESVACQRAIDAAEANGGGTVVFHAGSFVIGTSLTVPSNVTLQGAGRRATFLKRPVSATNQILTIDGEDAVTLVERVWVRDVCLDGRNTDTPVLKSRYGSVLCFLGVDTISCTGDAWYLVQAWDCRYWDCRWLNCAETTSQAACIRFRNSEASSGFGFSADNSNEQKFFGCVWETFKGHAVWVERGTNNSSSPNGFSFFGCKWETVHGRREVIYFDPNANVQRVLIVEGYIAVVGADSGASAFDVVYCGLNGSYRDMWVTIGAAGIVNSVFKINSGATNTFDNVLQTGQAPNTALVNVIGGAGAVMTRGLRCSTGVEAVALSGGTSSPAGMEVVRVSGAGKTTMSDADFYAYGGLMPVKNASGALVKNTSDGSYRFFVRTETSTWKGVELTL